MTLTLTTACFNKADNVNTDGGDTIKFKYAEHITAVRHSNYIDVKLSNPWKSGSTLHRYMLIDRKDSAKVRIAQDATAIYTPIRRAIVTTSPHCRLLYDMGVGEAIKGVCDIAYITTPFIKRLAAEGAIADCGNSMSPSIEKVISLSPDAMFVSPFEGSSYTQLETAGIPIIECADYMETSALGRAEWMRFYAMLTGKESKADSLFAAIEHRYKQTALLANKQKKRPKVITERVTNGVWYCPGGNSSMAKVIKDAGGNYTFANDTHSGSLNPSPEMVISKAANADIWMFVYYGNAPLTRKELITEYSGYRTIKAFNEKNIYECNGKLSTYFEEISFRPDLLIDELYQILHTKNNSLRYYKRINE